MRRLRTAALIAAFAVGVSAPAAYAGQGNPSQTGTARPASRARRSRRLGHNPRSRGPLAGFSIQ
jgi:hypothetical protein